MTTLYSLVKPHAPQVSGGAIICLVWLLVIPFYVFHLRKYCKLRNQQYIRKRYFQPVIVQVIFLLIFLGIVRPVHISMYCEIIPLSWHPYVHKIISLFSVLVNISIACMFALRSWLLWYDVNWTITSENHQWVRHINPSSFENNWYITHKDTYGNLRWVFTHRLVYSYVLICAVILVLAVPRLLIVYTLFATLVRLCLLGVGCYLWYKLPIFDDRFFIRQEYSYIVRLIMLAVFLKMTTFIVHLVFMDTRYQWIASLSAEFVFVGFPIAVCYVSLIWVIRTNIVNHNNSSPSHVLSPPTLRKKITPQSLGSSLQRFSVSMSKILKYSETYNIFMQHLLKEFSSENLLATTEMLQFRDQVYDEFDGDITDIPQFKLLNLRGLWEAKSFPKSVIVFDEKMSSHQKALRLIEKYVLFGAQYEVNLSYESRMQMTGQYNDELVHSVGVDLVSVFDCVLIELYRLMRDSYSRFRNTGAYHKCVHILDKKEAHTPFGLPSLLNQWSASIRSSINHSQTSPFLSSSPELNRQISGEVFRL